MDKYQNLKEIGKKRANTAANADNAMKLDDADVGTAGQDKGSQALGAGKKVTGVIVDGTTHTFDTQNTVGSTDAIEDQILDVLDEINPIVLVDYSSGTLTVTHVGEQTVSKVTTDDTDVTMTRKTDTALICNWSWDALDDVTNFNYGDSTEALSGGPYSYTQGDSGANDTAAGNIKSDLHTAFDNLEIAYESGDTTVAVNDDDSGFDIDIRAALNATADIDGTGPTHDGGCDEEWIS